MTQLYQLTKTLIDEIKARRPEIRIITYFVIYEDGTQDSNESAYETRRKYIKKLDCDTLLTLIPELFGEVENPEYITTSKAIEALANTPQTYAYWELVGVKNRTPFYLAKVLLERYFVDGLWIESQEAVLEDLLENVKKHL